MNKRASGDGERAAMSGYRLQYEIAASLILHYLRTDTLEWIKLVDPEAASIDDIQIATPGRLDAYQVKWSQYSGSVTYNHFVSDTKDEDSPLLQLAKGWAGLRKSNPDREVTVHWLTNDQASSNEVTNIPYAVTKPKPCHFAAFLEQVLFPVKKGNKSESIPSQWQLAWQKWLDASQLPEDERINFICHSDLDLRFLRPLDKPVHSVDDQHAINQIRILTDWITENIADPKRQIQYFPKDILAALNISEAPGTILKQEFPVDEKLYRPIDTTKSEIDRILQTLKGGYIALIGPPGSGKSTLLTQYLRYKQIRLIRYYAYVPNTRNISALRGESESFLRTIVDQIDSLGYRVGDSIQAHDREALLHRLKSQIQLLHEKYKQDNKITIILVDGLDHIHRELRPERSLLADLPSPEELPEGIFMLLGTQTLNLPDLPRSIGRCIADEDRHVNIDALPRQYVYEIIDAIGLPFEPTASMCGQIYDLSNGHPLSLRYILEKLQNAHDVESANVILDDGVIWGSDIEKHYSQYWDQIKPNDELVGFLGLISRIPGHLDLRWINTWPEAKLLRKIDEQFGYLFRKESEYKWSLFHNSFKLFLIEKTREVQPGLSDEICDQQYHATLALRCEIPNSIDDFSWDKIYYLERSAQHEQVLQAVDQNLFRKQFFSLRPRYAIWDDIFSGLHSTAVLQNPVALVQLILAGQELESRGEVLGLSELNIPEVLISIGQYEKALLHIRDGSQLIINETDGLKYACQLFDAGESNEASEIFELCEPLEYLSGSVVLEIEPNHSDTKILKRWVKAAVRFRDLSSILSVIPNVKAERKNIVEQSKIEEVSQEIQEEMYNVLGKELLFFERLDDFHELLGFVESNLNESSDIVFNLLCDLCEYLRNNRQDDQAKDILSQIEKISDNNQIYEWQKLWIAKETIKHKGDSEKIGAYIADVPLLEVSRNDYYSINDRPLDELSWDMIHVAILYYLGNAIDLTEIVPDASESRSRGGILFKRAVAAIGKIIGAYWKGEILGKSALQQIYVPIIRLFYRDGRAEQDWSNWHSYRSDSGRLYDYLVQAVRQHGDMRLEELKQVFENEWDGESSRRYWYNYQIRKTVLALWKAGISDTWVCKRLQIIEDGMLEWHDASGRLDELYEQIKAWLVLKEIDRAEYLLKVSLESSLGVGYRKDYQLDYWIKLYRRLAPLMPEQALSRCQLIAEAIPSLEHSTEGQSSAAILLIRALVEISPRRGVMLFWTFWKSGIISFQKGLSALIDESLKSEQLNLKLVCPVILKLLLPFSTTAPDDIIKKLIEKVFLTEGRQSTIDIGIRILDTVDILALSHVRPYLHYCVAESLQNSGITEAKFVDMPKPPDSNNHYSPPDRTVLELEDDTKMSFDQVLETIQDFESFIKLFRQEKYHYFDWFSLVPQLFTKLSSDDIESLSVYFDKECKSWALLNCLAEQHLNKGDKAKAYQLLMLSIQHIKNGDGVFYDKVNRLDTFRLLKKIDPEEATKQTYLFLESELVDSGRIYIFRSTSRVLLEVFDIICEKLPYGEMGDSLDNYMTALFKSENRAAMDFFAQDVQGDTINRALADFVCDDADHAVSVIRQFSQNVMIECLYEDVPEILDAIVEKLNCESFPLSILLAVTEASKTKTLPFDKLAPIVQRLTQSNNIIVAQMARDMAINMGIEIFPIAQDKNKDLPPIYYLSIPENHMEGIWYDKELKSGELLPDTQDPRELVKPNDRILKIISQDTGIPLINLCMRVVNIVKEKGSEGLLKGSHEEALRRRLEYTGLKMTYTRPRSRVIDSAMWEVVGELAKAGKLPEAFLRFFGNHLHPYDRAFLVANSVKRPEDILAIPSVGIGIKDLDFWTKTKPDNYSPEGETNKTVIFAEEVQVRKLSHRTPFEMRMTSCKPESLMTQESLCWGKAMDCRVKDYLNVHLYEGENYLVFQNDSRKTETGLVQWLAFNPYIALKLGWDLVTNAGWFYWVDTNGEFMAKSIWWKDGLIEWYETHSIDDTVEVAEGWRVVLSKKALDLITERYGKISRENYASRSFYDDEGIIHQKDYEWCTDV